MPICSCATTVNIYGCLQLTIYLKKRFILIKLDNDKTNALFSCSMTVYFHFRWCSSPISVCDLVHFYLSSV